MDKSFTSHTTESDSPLYVPVMQPLPRMYRRLLFLFACLLFALAVPIFILYSTGYRFNPFATEIGITATGGLYVGILEGDGDIFLNNQSVRGSRIFLSGVYLQNIEPGVQQLHVQSSDLQTWVKDLPVFPHIVTEAQAFLLPVRPQVRVVTPTIDIQSVAVLPATSTATTSLALASSSNAYRVMTNSTTTRTQYNSEYTFLEQLFNELVYDDTTSSQSPSATQRFSFGAVTDLGTAATATSTIIATSTKERSGRRLSLRDGELFVQYVGVARGIPEYFCVPNYAVASSSELYGAQVGYGIDLVTKLNIFPQPPNRESTISSKLESKVCRSDIRLDTKRQEVKSFYFLPNTSDFAIMHLEHGIYVVEFDDWSWQNVQQLYPGTAEALLVDNNRIYVTEGGIYLELYTTLHSS